MNIYTGLLFNLGYVQDPALARELAGEPGQAEPPAPAAGASAEEAVAGAGTRAQAARLMTVRRGHGWVELQAVLLSAFR